MNRGFVVCFPAGVLDSSLALVAPVSCSVALSCSPSTLTWHPCLGDWPVWATWAYGGEVLGLIQDHSFHPRPLSLSAYSLSEPGSESKVLGKENLTLLTKD